MHIKDVLNLSSINSNFRRNPIDSEIWAEKNAKLTG